VKLVSFEDHLRQLAHSDPSARIRTMVWEALESFGEGRATILKAWIRSEDASALAETLRLIRAEKLPEFGSELRLIVRQASLVQSRLLAFASLEDLGEDVSGLLTEWLASESTSLRIAAIGSYLGVAHGSKNAFFLPAQLGKRALCDAYANAGTTS